MQVFTAILLLTGLALAVRADLLEHRIPNALTGVALVAGLLLQTLTHGYAGCLTAAAGAATGLCALLPFYLLRGMGAGDVKLMAAAGSFLGPLGALHAAAVTLVIGALLAAGVIVSRRLVPARTHGEQIVDEFLAPGAAPVSLLSIRKEKFPYAVAIAGGTVLVMWAQGQLAYLTTFVMGWGLE